MTNATEPPQDDWWSRRPTWLLFVLVFVGGSAVLVAGVIAVAVVLGAIVGDSGDSATASGSTGTTLSSETTTTVAEATTTSMSTPTTSSTSTTTSEATISTTSASPTTATESETEVGKIYPSGTELIFSADTDWSSEGGWVTDYLSESDVALVVEEDGAKGFTQDGIAVGGWERLAVNGVTTNLILIDRACIDSRCSSEILHLADDNNELRRSIWVLVDDDGLFSQALAFQFREDEGDGQACWSRSSDGPVVPTTDGYQLQRAWVFADGDAGKVWYIADQDRLDIEVMSAFSMGLFPEWIQC